MQMKQVRSYPNSVARQGFVVESLARHFSASPMGWLLPGEHWRVLRSLEGAKIILEYHQLSRGESTSGNCACPLPPSALPRPTAASLEKAMLPTIKARPPSPFLRCPFLLFPLFHARLPSMQRRLPDPAGLLLESVFLTDPCSSGSAILPLSPDCCLLTPATGALVSSSCTFSGARLYHSAHLARLPSSRTNQLQCQLTILLDLGL